MRMRPGEYKKLQDFDAPYIKYKIARHIMIALGIGFATVGLLTSPFGMYFLVKGAIHGVFNRRDFNREIKKLQKQGFIALTKTEDGWIIKLLKKGKGKLKKIQVQELKLTIEKHWDGKWRIFIFDIPEEAKRERDMLTRKLKDLGMFHIQRSSFIYPFDCRDELEFIAKHYGVWKHTTYGEISKIDIEKQLRRYFIRKKIL